MRRCSSWCLSVPYPSMTSLFVLSQWTYLHWGIFSKSDFSTGCSWKEIPWWSDMLCSDRFCTILIPVIKLCLLTRHSIGFPDVAVFLQSREWTVLCRTSPIFCIVERDRWFMELCPIWATFTLVEHQNNIQTAYEKMAMIEQWIYLPIGGGGGYSWYAFMEALIHIIPSLGMICDPVSIQ